DLIRKAQNSELAKILISKAFTLGKMGGFEESVDLYEQIELRYGEIPELYYYWGSTYFENNYIERGCDLISKAAQLGYNINNLEADCR
ncbi:MAG: hypothetical protein GY816_09880, partial [Cytophagales bacterium]|nr:hypothetical protein [Cytophagales bacterium]